MQWLVFGVFLTFCFLQQDSILKLVWVTIWKKYSQFFITYNILYSITVLVCHVALFLSLTSSYWPWLTKYPSSPKHWCKKWFIRTIQIHAHTHVTFTLLLKPTYFSTCCLLLKYHAQKLRARKNAHILKNVMKIMIMKREHIKIRWGAVGTWNDTNKKEGETLFYL